VRPDRRRDALVVLAALASLAAPSAAQEAIWMPAATQPSPGQWIATEKARYYRFETDATNDVRSILGLETSVAYGIVSRLSVQADLPAYWKDAGTPGRTSVGLGDLALSLKLRVLQEDLGPVDTVRAAIFGGVELPTGTEDFGSSSTDPFVGGVVTGIFGRHGVNAAARWTFVTGQAFDPVFAGDAGSDLLDFNASYVYRLLPETYTEVHEPALYAVLDLDGTWETNGDLEVFLAPGILWEAQRAALEFSVGFPIARSVEHRPRGEWRVNFGVRLLF